MAEKALRQLERRFGPFDSEEKAREVILRNFHRMLPKELHRLGMDMKRWGNEYLRLCQKSKNRDEKGWHSFGLEQVAEAELIDQSEPTHTSPNPPRLVPDVVAAASDRDARF